uniref:Uncharacterized protein n=1 Tax=Peronospora matthiolae TaxID=2874970 RepID=A0AAV1VI73_9STRA
MNSVISSPELGRAPASFGGVLFDEGVIDIRRLDAIFHETSSQEKRQRTHPLSPRVDDDFASQESQVLLCQLLGTSRQREARLLLATIRGLRVHS